MCVCVREKSITIIEETDKKWRQPDDRNSNTHTASSSLLYVCDTHLGSDFQFSVLSVHIEQTAAETTKL